MECAIDGRCWWELWIFASFRSDALLSKENFNKVVEELEWKLKLLVGLRVEDVLKKVGKYWVVCGALLHEWDS